MHSNSQTVDAQHYARLWKNSLPAVAWGTIGLFVAIVLGYGLVLTAAMMGDLPYTGSSLICGVLAYTSFTVMHDASHGAIFEVDSRLKILETALGWAASLPLLVAPYSLFKKVHERHHAFTNDPGRDPDHFTFGDKWYQVLLNCLFIPVRYHLLALGTLRQIKMFRDTYLSTVLYFIMVIGSLTMLVNLGYATQVVCFAIIPTLIATVLLTLFFDYFPHHSHKSLGRFHNTGMYPGKWLNVLLLGQNYHLIHHLYPRVPWYKYREVYQQILPYLKAQQSPTGAVHTLAKVTQIQLLTEDSVVVTLKLPQGQRLDYKAGQYITVSKWLDSQQQTRCYSLCSFSDTSPEKGELKIGVRHTPTGLMSGFINQTLKTGDELIIQGPFGDFVYPPTHDNTIKSLVLIAGGSGITPIFSIIQAVLTQQQSTPVHLIYACRNADNIMFHRQLESLRAAHPSRLKITYLVKTRLNSAMLPSLLPVAALNEVEFYVCGPEGLKNMVVKTLNDTGIKDHRVHVEQFVASEQAPIGVKHRVKITLADGHKHVFNVATNQTILQVANAQNITLPHACGNGTCGSCKLKVAAGSVDNICDTVPGITSQEKTAGYTLACQCKPLGDVCLSELRG
jgi:ferredoxin-NADP reductase/fatty-acid desaturase